MRSKSGRGQGTDCESMSAGNLIVTDPLRAVSGAATLTINRSSRYGIRETDKNMKMVEIKNLTKRFGPLVAVNDISFSVKRGEVLGFLGPNGAGKSTTMKMITGFLAADGGSVKIGGHDIGQHPVRAKRLLGYLPEGAPAYPDMTPFAFLSFIAQMRGFAGAERTRCIDTVVEKVNLQDVLFKPIETLSKGFKRRVGLAQAILHDPDILILDEPTDGLDPNQKHEVRTLIQEMAQQKAIILSTHILEEVDAVCSRAVIIAGGKIVADDSPANLEARSPIHNSVTLCLNSDDQTLGDALRQLPGVETVELLDRQDNAMTFRILAEHGQTVLPGVTEFTRERNLPVAELHVHKGRMDDVFRTLTMEHQERT
jgi:ABC-2 type transport system ATP-binding protein